MRPRSVVLAVKVIEGRWQDVLPGSYDPERAVVVTDPPYGLGAEGGSALRGVGGHMGLGLGRKDIDKGYQDDIPWSRHVEEVLDLLPARRHVIRGPATTLIRRDYPQPRRVCVEMAAYRRRAANRPGVVPYLWQGWAVYGRLQLERHRRAPIGDAFASTFLLQQGTHDHRGKRTAHRALTPFSSCSWIVDTWVDPGCVVVDPFAGLGTIGLAARAHGFDYIGAEVNPEYAAIANEAFLTEALALGLPA
jgi:DNA modification methylase